MSWLVWLGAALGVCGAAWQLTRPRYGGPDGTGCAFCTRRSIGSVQQYRAGRRPGKVIRYCERHVGAAVGPVKR